MVAAWAPSRVHSVRSAGASSSGLATTSDTRAGPSPAGTGTSKPARGPVQAKGKRQAAGEALGGALVVLQRAQALDRAQLIPLDQVASVRQARTMSCPRRPAPGAAGGARAAALRRRPAGRGCRGSRAPRRARRSSTRDRAGSRRGPSPGGRGSRRARSPCTHDCGGGRGATGRPRGTCGSAAAGPPSHARGATASRPGGDWGGEEQEPARAEHTEDLLQRVEGIQVEMLEELAEEHGIDRPRRRGGTARARLRSSGSRRCARASVEEVGPGSRALDRVVEADHFPAAGLGEGGQMSRERADVQEAAAPARGSSRSVSW